MKPLGDFHKDPKLFESHDRRPEKLGASVARREVGAIILKRKV
jgi:hypothetical protein